MNLPKTYPKKKEIKFLTIPNLRKYKLIIVMVIFLIKILSQYQKKLINYK